ARTSLSIGATAVQGSRYASRNLRRDSADDVGNSEAASFMRWNRLKNGCESELSDQSRNTGPRTVIRMFEDQRSPCSMVSGISNCASSPQSARSVGPSEA